MICRTYSHARQGAGGTRPHAQALSFRGAQVPRVKSNNAKPCRGHPPPPCLLLVPRLVQGSLGLLVSSYVSRVANHVVAGAPS